jgi:ferredoxin-NADP reductase
MRLGEPRMPSLLVAHHRPGFYLRVITEGHVEAGDEIVRTRTGRHELSVADIDALLYLPGRDEGTLRKAVDIPALSPGWQSSFRDLLGSAPAPAPTGWSGFRPLRVARVVPESTTVSSIHLAADDGAPLPRPEPGQYLTLRVPGAGDPAPVRSYSLSAAPSDHEYRISVKRDGVVSRYLHTRLTAGALVDVAAPRGDFVLAGDDRPVVLVSAGIGVTPVLAMLHALAARRTTREVWWLHTTRTAAEHAFAAEAHRLLASLPHGREHVYYTSETGRLTRDGLSTLDLPADATAYLCGPDTFMAAMRESLVSLGFEASRVHSELFGGVSAINPGLTGVVRKTPHLPPGVAGTGPAVTFARSGLTVPWSEEYPSLLEFAEACDVPTRWSCRTGVCHTCVTPVLSGRVDYDPDPLEPPAAGEALVCCARPREDVVLDL